MTDARIARDGDCDLGDDRCNGQRCRNGDANEDKIPQHADSGDSSHAAKTRALAMQSAGIDGVIAKPFLLIDLHAEISRLAESGRVSARHPVGMVS